MESFAWSTALLQEKDNEWRVEWKLGDRCKGDEKEKQFTVCRWPLTFKEQKNAPNVYLN